MAEQPTVWEEVRRRRMGKVCIAYLAASFAVIEIITLDAIGLPDVVVRALIGAVSLGFPVALVLAWTYDLTPRGVVKTPETEQSTDVRLSTGPGWLAITVVSLLIGTVVHIARG